MSLVDRRSKMTATTFWICIRERRWDDLKKLLAEDFEAYWPQSKEEIRGAENYIAINREYPGTDKIQFIDEQVEHNDIEHVDQVVTQVLIESKMPDGKETVLFAISFFAIRDGLIQSVMEYWADTYPAPDWRRKYVVVKERY